MTATKPEPLVQVVADGAAATAVDLAQLARLNPERYPFLLESAAVSGEQARFDILFAFPGETLELAAGNALSGPHAAASGDFLASLDAWWAAERADAAPATAKLPFRGGWFVYLGYELAGQIEPGLQLSRGNREPLAFATRVPLAVIRDHGRQQLIIVGERAGDPRARHLQADLRALADMPPTVLQAATGRLHEDPPAAFLAAVGEAQRYITAGDNYQTNLSRCWRVELASPLPPAELYLRLRRANPAPFAGLLQHSRFAVVASSPERLVRRAGDRIDTRPIAGTQARTGKATETAALLAHPKERAEHVMLIDLERNDLGRVCRGGSVEVDEFMVVESYTHVHHIVSNVSGVARSGLGPGELLRAVFPGGTITGCPKVRTMEIIAELEGRPRGAYTGSFGYLNRDGDCDLNILIRTITQRGNELEIAAGSGIVADSIPQRELAETRSKAKGMLLALDLPGDSVWP